MTEQNKPYDPYEHEPMPEGEEKAPPLVHTMAIVRWIILAGMTLFAVIMILSYFGATHWSHTQKSVAQYNCPMHPTYVSNQPGECAICGMNLVPVDKEGRKASREATLAAPQPSNSPARERPLSRARPACQTCRV